MADEGKAEDTKSIRLSEPSVRALILEMPEGVLIELARTLTDGEAYPTGVRKAIARYKAEARKTA